MVSRKVLLVDMGIILAAFLVGGYIYHLLPVRMPVHWGMDGQPDSYAGRFVGVFGLPISMAISVFLMISLPWLDPEDVKLSRHYNLLLVVVPAVLFAIYLWIIFKLSAVVVLAGLIFPQYQSYLSTTVIIVTPLCAIIYSSFVYLKEQRGG